MDRGFIILVGSCHRRANEQMEDVQFTGKSWTEAVIPQLVGFVLRSPYEATSILTEPFMITIHFYPIDTLKMQGQRGAPKHNQRAEGRSPLWKSAMLSFSALHLPHCDWIPADGSPTDRRLCTVRYHGILESHE